MTRPSARSLGADDRQGGFALLLALLAIAVLAALSAHLIRASGQRAGTALFLRDSIRLEAAADGAVFDTILAVIRDRGTAGFVTRAVAIGGVDVDVRLEDQAVRLNPNTASLEALRALMPRIGLDPDTANRLSRSIMDWRTRIPDSLLGGSKVEQYRRAGLAYAPPNQPFTSVEEMGLVLGMTPDILARLRPLVSVVREQGHMPVDGLREQPNPGAEPGGPEHASSYLRPNTVYQIEAQARLPGGGRFVRRAVVRVKMTPERGAPPYEILGWETQDD